MKKFIVLVMVYLTGVIWFIGMCCVAMIYMQNTLVVRFVDACHSIGLINFVIPFNIALIALILIVRDLYKNRGILSKKEETE